MQLQVICRTPAETQYPYAIRGTIRQFCQALYDELLTSGYSLLLEDIEMLALQDVKLYAGWARLDAQYTDEPVMPPMSFFALTLDISLLADEWAIVLPVIRAHCDLLQARRMEGSSALGVQPFGISSSEANQAYMMAIEQMKKEAFSHTPFSIDWDD